MSKAAQTREKLLQQGRLQFWAKGYSNVSVRQIAMAAGVDVALISRHFGSKLGLFEATLEGAFHIFETPPQTENELIEQFVQLYSEKPRMGTEPTAFNMLLTNAHDEDVGERVRALYNQEVQQELAQILGVERAALFAAVLFGVSLVEKSLQVDGIAEPASDAYKTQLRHLMQAALNYSSETER